MRNNEYFFTLINKNLILIIRLALIHFAKCLQNYKICLLCVYLNEKLILDIVTTPFLNFNFLRI